MNRTFALEPYTHFLGETRTELYKKYCSGVLQMKNAHMVKNALQRRALPGLERRGA